MRIGVIGGTFNPVHCGHLLIAQDALEQLSLDRVLFIPTATPPHKTPDRLAAGKAHFIVRRYGELERHEGPRVLSTHDVAGVRTTRHRMRSRTSSPRRARTARTWSA